MADKHPDETPQLHPSGNRDTDVHVGPFPQRLDTNPVKNEAGRTRPDIRDAIHANKVAAGEADPDEPTPTERAHGESVPSEPAPAEDDDAAPAQRRRQSGAKD